MQVAAFMALMECVRGERPGVFNNRLYHRLLDVLLTSAGTAPEVLGLLIGKLLGGCWLGAGWLLGGCWADDGWGLVGGDLMNAGVGPCWVLRQLSMGARLLLPLTMPQLAIDGSP